MRDDGKCLWNVADGLTWQIRTKSATYTHTQKKNNNNTKTHINIGINLNIRHAAYRSIIQETLKAVLDILDSCNKAAISMAVQIILEKFLFYARDNNDIINGVNAIALQRRSSIILRKKLNEVLQTDSKDQMHQILMADVFARCVDVCTGQQGNKS